MRCAPFTPALYQAMIRESVSLAAIATKAGVQNRYTEVPLSELRVESELLWLIQVGLLRREVDGQGLTDSFRVTPLGRHIVEPWQQQPEPIRLTPSWGDRAANSWQRWVRLPF